MNKIAEGKDINELVFFDGVFEQGEEGAVGIDLDRMLTPAELQSLQADMVRQGAVITDVTQDGTGKLTIAFVNTTPQGVGFVGVLTIIGIAVGGFVLMGVAIFGWTLWSALKKTPWPVWWLAGGLVVFLLYKAFIKVGPAAAKAAPGVVKAARR